MKIQDPSLNQAALSQVTGTQQVQTAQGAKRAGAATGPEDSDRVQLSDLSGRLVTMLSADSPERVSRVEKLAADFKTGAYQPNAAATARGIVSDAISGGA